MGQILEPQRPLGSRREAARKPLRSRILRHRWRRGHRVQWLRGAGGVGGLSHCVQRGAEDIVPPAARGPWERLLLLLRHGLRNGLHQRVDQRAGDIEERRARGSGGVEGWLLHVPHVLHVSHVLLGQRRRRRRAEVVQKLQLPAGFPWEVALVVPLWGSQRAGRRRKAWASRPGALRLDQQERLLFKILWVLLRVYGCYLGSQLSLKSLKPLTNNLGQPRAWRPSSAPAAPGPLKLGSRMAEL